MTPQQLDEIRRRAQSAPASETVPYFDPRTDPYRTSTTAIPTGSYGGLGSGPLTVDAGQGNTGSPQPPPYRPPVTAPGGTNSRDQVRGDRDFIYQRGDEIYRDSQQRAEEARQRRGGFYERAANDAYTSILEGRGGYRPEEEEDILGRDRLDGMMLTGDEEQSMFLSGDEYNRVMGNPWDRAAFFDPTSDMEAEYGSANRQRGVVDRFSNEIDAAIRPDDLRLSGTYDEQQQAALTGGDSAVRGAIDPSRMRLSKDFMANYRMSPEEFQSRLDMAGLDSMTVSQAAMDRATQAGRAAGMDPLGMAGYTSRAARDGRIDAANNITRARGQAYQDRAERERAGESMRLGAEQGYAGMASNAELELQRRRLTAAGEREGMRMGAERDVSNRQMQAAGERAQLGAGTERAINEQQRQQRQYNTSTGTQIATGIERDTADRSRVLAENRQQTQQGIVDARYNRNRYRDQQIAGRRGAVADARRGDEREARGYMTGMTGMFNQNEQNEYDRQQRAYQTQVGGANDAARTGVLADQRPKWWESLLAAGAQAAGGIAAAV